MSGKQENPARVGGTEAKYIFPCQGRLAQPGFTGYDHQRRGTVGRKPGIGWIKRRVYIPQLTFAPGKVGLRLAQAVVGFQPPSVTLRVQSPQRTGQEAATFLQACRQFRRIGSLRQTRRRSHYACTQQQGIYMFEAGFRIHHQNPLGGVCRLLLAGDPGHRQMRLTSPRAEKILGGPDQKTLGCGQFGL